MNGIVILGCGACFRSGRPRVSSAALLHLTLIMWLMPINTTETGWTARDKGLPFCVRAPRDMGVASLQLIPPIQPVKHAHTNISSASPHPLGSLIALLVLTLLKVCHIFLIIFTGTHAGPPPSGLWM